MRHAGPGRVPRRWPPPAGARKGRGCEPCCVARRMRRWLRRARARRAPIRRRRRGNVATASPARRTCSRSRALSAVVAVQGDISPSPTAPRMSGACASGEGGRGPRNGTGTLALRVRALAVRATLPVLAATAVGGRHKAGDRPWHRARSRRDRTVALVGCRVGLTCNSLCGPGNDPLPRSNGRKQRGCLSGAGVPPPSQRTAAHVRGPQRPLH